MPIEVDVSLFYQALGAVVILLATYLVGKAVEKVLKGGLKKAGIPETETIIVSSGTKYTIYFIGILVSLGHIGMSVTPFLAALAIIAVVFGFTARSAIENVVSGYLLRAYSPFEVGDLIKVGDKVGVVKELDLLKTRIETPERLCQFIPNATILHSELCNFTRYGSEYPVKMEVNVPYSADLEKVRLSILDMISAYPMLSPNKPVQVFVKHFTDSGVVLWIQFFVSQFGFKEGAKDFVASRILEKYRSGEIKLSYQPQRVEEPLHSKETMSLEEEKTAGKEGAFEKQKVGENRTGAKLRCPMCDSVNWHGYLRCKLCLSYYVWAKCQACDHVRLEKCLLDEGELEFIAP
jgi:small conductance mechanosensitive channel